MAMIFRRPGKTGIENLDAGKPVGSFNGNNCHSSSNERKRTMKLNSIIFYLCAGVCSSALIDSAFAMNNDKEMKNTTCKLDSYRAMISSKYFDSIQDFANLEMANPKFCDNIDKFHYNPISITPDQLHLWSHLETLHLYTDDDIDTWIKAQNDIDDLHKIEVWPCMSDENAVKNMKELERFVAKSENHHATITFHNVTLTDPKILGKFNEDWKYTFNENVYTNGERKNANFVITSIDDSAFNGCSGFTSITIPCSVISIGYGAFGGCTELASITMSNSISGLHSDTFYECDKVNFNVASEAMKKYLCSNCNIAEDKVTVDSSLYNEHYSWKWPEDGCIHFPADATRVADYMFCGRSDIKSVDLTNVAYIGVCAFEGCTGLSSITIPNTVEYIDGYAFAGCTELTSVTIPNSVLSIEHLAFGTLNDQTKIKVSSESMKQHLLSTDSVSESQIEVDSSLYEEHNAWKWPANGLMQPPANITYINDAMFGDRSDILSVIIPNGVTSIGEEAFSGCKCLTSVEIPNGVQSIGAGAFFGCSGLTSITIPNSVITIDEMLLGECEGLKEINVFNEATKQLVIDSTPRINPDIIKVIE